METWETLLEIRWPDNACDRSGECCRGAGQIAPWKNLLRNAAEGNQNARNFLNQFIPYASQKEAHQEAPYALEASLALVRERGDTEEDLILYRCQFLKGQSECQIYEDRPTLCRDFPESPFGAIPRCCGYYPVTMACREKLADMRRELNELKKQAQNLES